MALTTVQALRRLGGRPLAGAAIIVTVVVLLMYEPLKQAEGGDSAVYDYISQSILRGRIPYRDVVDIKWPGGPYLSAFAMAVGKLVGIRDIIAVRLFQIFSCGLLSAATFLAALRLSRNRAAAMISCLVPLMNYRFAGWVVGGTQPKLMMILFGMVSLLLVDAGEPFWSGLCSMLSCICWQPGLLFTGVSFLVSSRYLRSWRDLRAFYVVLGSAIPLVLLFGYFLLKGSFGDFWAWTMTYNYSIFGPDAVRPLTSALSRLRNVVTKIFEGDILVVVLAAAGFILLCVQRVRAKFTAEQPRTTREDFKDAIVIAPMVYLTFCLINFQAGPDLIPLFPFIGIFAGWLLVRIGHLASARVSRAAEASPVRWGAAAMNCIAACLLALVLVRGGRYRLDGILLSDQDDRMRHVSELLGPDDKLYVHGAVEFLVLLNRPNLNPYILLDWRADEFAGRGKTEGFNQIIEDMEAQKPKVVVLSRLNKLTHRKELADWAEEHYDELESEGRVKLYLRKR